MTNAWDHRIGALPVAELERRQAVDDAWDARHPGDRRGLMAVCRASSRCSERAVFEATYRYLTGRRRRVLWARKLICQEHGVRFAAEHGLVLPVAAWAAPFVDPAGCDHEGEFNMHLGCSRCCPCLECGVIRAGALRDDPSGLRPTCEGSAGPAGREVR